MTSGNLAERIDGSGVLISPMVTVEPPQLGGLGRTISLDTMPHRRPVKARRPVTALTAMPSSIGLCGAMGAGKDTVGALLSMVGYEMVAFGDALRQEVHGALATHTLPKDHAFSTDFIAAWDACDAADVWTKPTYSAMRVVLQYWGTEYRRDQDPDYWVKQLTKNLQQGHRYCCTDVRFPNEVDFIRRYQGGKVWLIERQQARRDGIAGHASERLVDTVVADVRLPNNGTLRDLARDVKLALFMSESIV